LHSPMLHDIPPVSEIDRQVKLLLPGGGPNSASVWVNLDAQLDRELSKVFPYGVWNRNLDAVVGRFPSVLSSFLLF
jgi:hypothetical protein